MTEHYIYVDLKQAEVLLDLPEDMTLTRANVLNGSLVLQVEIEDEDADEGSLPGALDAVYKDIGNGELVLMQFSPRE